MRSMKLTFVNIWMTRKAWTVCLWNSNNNRTSCYLVHFRLCKIKSYSKTIDVFLNVLQLWQCGIHPYVMCRCQSVLPTDHILGYVLPSHTTHQTIVWQSIYPSQHKKINCLLEAGDIVTLPIKSASFVVAYSSFFCPKLFQALGGSFQSLLDHLLVDWHSSKWCIYYFNLLSLSWNKNKWKD